MKKGKKEEKKDVMDTRAIKAKGRGEEKIKRKLVRKAKERRNQGDDGYNKNKDHRRKEINKW